MGTCICGFCSVWVCVCVGVLVMCVLVFIVFLYCLYCIFVLFRVCIFIIICSVCTTVRTTVTEWKLNCSSCSSNDNGVTCKTPIRFTSGCVNGELKRADVALAYRQTLTKSLTYDLSSEECMNMQWTNLSLPSAESEGMLPCAQQNYHWSLQWA